MVTDRAAARTVSVVSLGCARNDVDSEELAGRLAANGWTLVAHPEDADVAVVNTCGFVEQAKKDSIDTLLAAADLKERGRTRAAVAVGCLAERYGEQLAAALPEADAVLGFDTYTGMSAHLHRILAGERPTPHVPRDRRRLLPVAPALRQPLTPRFAPSPSDVVRRRLDGRAWAPLKIASGCDRRCAFCAIPAFRGAFVSRRPEEIIAEARWLVGTGVRELFCVSENSTSYGKDLGEPALLESLLPELAAIDGITRVRLSYLQPAETRPGLLRTVADTPGVAPYFDVSFQHASAPLLRRMRRFGDRALFLRLVEQIRELAPEAGIRSNVIVGFPGETKDDLAELEDFLTQARLDVVGVFAYSDEDGTEAQGLPGHIDPPEVEARVERLARLVDELTAQRAQDRVGTRVEVLVDELDAEDPTDGEEPVVLGRAAFQGPESDGVCLLRPRAGSGPRVGDLVAGVVVESRGVDLVVEPS